MMGFVVEITAADCYGDLKNLKGGGRSKATLYPARRHHREGSSLDGSWPEGQTSCSAWPFVQGIIDRSKLRGVRKRPRLRQAAERNPGLARERGSLNRTLFLATAMR